MRGVLVLSFTIIVVVSAIPRQNDPDRIVGGSQASILQYPYMVALLSSTTGSGTFSQTCGGAIINNRSILTAAHCFLRNSFIYQWRHRIGSARASSGGDVVLTSQIIIHPNFNEGTLDMDFSVVRIVGTFPFSNTIQAASIAGPNYNVDDNQVIWAAGWGALCYRCGGSDLLLHTQIWSVNQKTCKDRYAARLYIVTDDMLCTGWLDQGGRDACQGDSGGPQVHNGVVVGVTSWGHECALPYYPGVAARVSSASNWIIANA